MSVYVFATSAEAYTYIELVKIEMMQHFGIPEEEAVGRINRAWHGLDCTAEDQVDAVMHEEPSFWARRIAYGNDACFWISEDGLQPVPYSSPGPVEHAPNHSRHLPRPSAIGGQQ